MGIRIRSKERERETERERGDEKLGLRLNGILCDFEEREQGGNSNRDDSTARWQNSIKLKFPQ